MSELQQSSTRPVAPTQAPGSVNAPADGAAEVYRRAMEAKPTGFAENPIGAMASAMDKLGKAAGTALAGKAMEGRDGLADGEAALKKAIQTMRANPESVEAKQRALHSGLALLEQMSNLAPNDPRRISVAKFVVNLANQLGQTPGQLPLNIAGTDVRGLLTVAAQILSRFGGAQDMQSAFTLESLLKQSLPATSAQAIAVRDELMQRLGLSQQAKAVLAQGWAVRVANPGEVPKLDLSARTIVLDAAQENPSLAVMARAFWQDHTLRTPQEKEGFAEAFQKIAHHGALTALSRKYKDVRDHARRELQQSRINVLGAATQTPSGSVGKLDESADMFASLATFSHSSANTELPRELATRLEQFYAPR